MIKSIAGLATRRFITQGLCRFVGLDAGLAQDRLDQIDAAASLLDLKSLNSVGLRRLRGDWRGYWSVDVNPPWRISFKFKGGHAHEIEILDAL